MSRGKLLTITQAARVLGIHPRTLRQWSDQGHIRHIQTPGGHRRFLEEDLSGFLQQMGRGNEDRALANAARKAIRAAIMRLPQDRPETSLRLPANLSREQRLSMRSIGRELVGVVIRYAAGHTEEAVLDQARELGVSYGVACRQNGLSVSETVAAFNFFRDPIIEVTFSSETERAGSDSPRVQLYRRLDHFFNEVLLATIRAVEKTS